MSYTVKWGRERLHFPLPSPDTKLAAIRAELSTYTQLPPDSFKLIHAGAVMKDDNVPISTYGIKRNSTIALVGGDTELPARGAATKERAGPRTEETTISQIRGELDSVRRVLQPDVDSFLTTLSAEPAPVVPAPAPTKGGKPGKSGKSEDKGKEQLAREHTRLGELLLQALLRLDAINAEGEWEAARRERKGAVREVQGLLDRLDSEWRARR